MSENQEINRKPVKKPALGRGLGSLLGEAASREAPEESVKPAQPPVNMVSKMIGSQEPALKEGFVESKTVLNQLAQNAIAPAPSATLSTPIESTPTIAPPLPAAAPVRSTNSTATEVTPTPAPVVATAVKEPSKIPDHMRIWNIDIAKLKPNKKQPRQVFAGEALKELTLSIMEKGILQPIVARPKMDGQFEIIAGERRWRAAQAAGLHEVPVILKATPDQEALELALIENIQRENLNPIEEAEAYNHLLQTYALTQQQLADKMGKDRATVANTLRLLGLAKPTRDLVANGQMSMGHAKVLLAVSDQMQQKSLADKVVGKKWSVRELEREVANLLKPKESSVQAGVLSGNVSQKFMTGLSEELQKAMGTKVAIDYDRGKGRINIHFYSDDELNGIVERLKESWRK